jgi:hypothetical protein
MSDKRGYEADLWKRARKGTDVRWLRNITITLLAGLVVPYLRLGRVDATALLLTWAVAASLFVAWEGGLFLYRRFSVAPFQKHQEQADTISHLTAQLDTLQDTTSGRQRRKDLAAALSRQASTATHELWNKRPANDPEDIRRWLERTDEWHSATIQIMRDGGCSEPEIESVQVLGNLAEFNPGNLRYSASGEIQRGLLRIEGYRQRLAPIIRRYDE